MGTNNFKRISICLVISFFLSSCTSRNRLPSSEHTPDNRLTPFTTDGCSKFPDGTPWADPQKWQHCCIYHDLAYWSGGSIEQRLEADQNLRSCVAKTGERVIADAMFIGVRAGGEATLPTSWRWGYGWAIPRGYLELSEGEKKQVAQMAPADPLQIPIAAAPVIPKRETLTGDYCLDEAIMKMRSRFGSHFTILDYQWSEAFAPEGISRKYEITTNICSENAVFEFLQLKKDACTTPSSELHYRAQTRLVTVSMCKK